MSYVSPTAQRYNAETARHASKAQREAQAELAARIGDGSQLTPEDFPRLTRAELNQLHTVAPDTYAALRDGRAPGAAWRPSGSREAGQ